MGTLDLSLPTTGCSQGRTGHYRAEQKPHHSECCGRWGSSILSPWPRLLAAAGWEELRARRSSHMQTHSVEAQAWAKLAQPGSADTHTTSEGCDITVHRLLLPPSDVTVKGCLAPEYKQWGMLAYNPSPGNAIFPPTAVILGHPSLHFLVPLCICSWLLQLHVTLSLLTHVSGSPSQLNASHQGFGHVSSFSISSSQHFCGHSCEFFRRILIPYHEQIFCLRVWSTLSLIFPIFYQAFQHSYEATVGSGKK